MGHTSASSRKNAWKDYCEYEAQLDRSIMDHFMSVLCTTGGDAELLDVARNRQFAIATRQGSWQVIETTRSSEPALGHGGDEGLALWHSRNAKRPAIAPAQEI